MINVIVFAILPNRSVVVCYGLSETSNKFECQNKLPLRDPLVEDPIGRGEFGAVYASVVVDNYSLVRKEMDNLEAAKREEKLLLSLSHDNVVAGVKVQGEGKKQVEERDGKTYYVIVMEYCNAGTLDQKIQTLTSNKGLTNQEILAWFSDIVSGLKYLHEQGIVHRDLKPANILLKKVGRGLPQAKISDFGLSRKLENGYSKRKKEELSPGGTPAYLAPELATHMDTSTFMWKLSKISIDWYAADIWALGMILYQMCFGFRKSPFELPEIKNAPNFKGDNGLKRSHGRDHMMQELIENMLEHDPENRWHIGKVAEKLKVRTTLSLHVDNTQLGLGSLAVSQSLHSPAFPLIAVLRYNPSEFIDPPFCGRGNIRSMRRALSLH